MKASRRRRKASIRQKHTLKEKNTMRKSRSRGEKRKVNIKAEGTENDFTATNSQEVSMEHERRKEDVSQIDSEPGSERIGDILFPVFREVPPLEPIHESFSTDEEFEWQKKRLDRLANEERILLRQDRIWQNEERRRARLLFGKSQAPPQNNHPTDLRIIPHRKVPNAVLP